MNKKALALLISASVVTLSGCSCWKKKCQPVQEETVVVHEETKQVVVEK